MRRAAAGRPGADPALPPGARRGAARPCQPHRPPRPQAVEHPRHPRWHGEAARLRHRQAARQRDQRRQHRADPAGGQRLHPGVRLAGTGAGRTGVGGHRRLQPGRAALPAPRRAAPHQRRVQDPIGFRARDSRHRSGAAERRDHPPGRRYRPGPLQHHRPAAAPLSRRPRQHPRAGAQEEPRRALCQRDRLRRRPQPLPPARAGLGPGRLLELSRREVRPPEPRFRGERAGGAARAGRGHDHHLDPDARGPAPARRGAVPGQAGRRDPHLPGTPDRADRRETAHHARAARQGAGDPRALQGRSPHHRDDAGPVRRPLRRDQRQPECRAALPPGRLPGARGRRQDAPARHRLFLRQHPGRRGPARHRARDGGDLARGARAGTASRPPLPRELPLRAVLAGEGQLSRYLARSPSPRRRRARHRRGPLDPPGRHRVQRDRRGHRPERAAARGPRLLPEGRRCARLGGLRGDLLRHRDLLQPLQRGESPGGLQRQSGDHPGGGAPGRPERSGDDPPDRRLSAGPGALHRRIPRQRGDLVPAGHLRCRLRAAPRGGPPGLDRPEPGRGPGRRPAARPPRARQRARLRAPAQATGDA